MHVFADGISKVTFSNGNLRIQLTQKGADDETVDAGTLIVPISQANNFVNGLAGSLKDLNEKLKEARDQQEQNQPAGYPAGFFEEILTDYALGKAMEEVQDDEEVDLETAMKLAGYSE